jgi:lipoprotein NlpD
VPGTYRVVRGDTLYAIAFRHGLDFRDVAAWNRIPPPYRIYAGQDLRLDAPDAMAHPAAQPNAPVAAATVPRVPPPSTAPAAAASTASPPGPSPPRPGMFEDVPSPPPAISGSPGTPNLATTAHQNAGNPAAPPAQAAAGKSAAPAQSATPTVPETSRPIAAEAAPSPRVADDSVVTSANGVSWRWPGRGGLIGTFVAGDQTRQGIDVAGKAGDPVLAAADGEVVYSGNGLLGYGELIIVKHNANFLSAYGHNRKRLVQEGDKVRGGQQIAEMGSSASSREELHFEIRKNGKPVNPLDYLPAR